MDTFTLAATSFIISLSLLITGKKDALRRSFAAFCAAIFVAQTAVFFSDIFAAPFWSYIEFSGTLAMAPLATNFFLHLTQKRSYLTRGSVAVTTMISTAGLVALFSPAVRWDYFPPALNAYAYIVLAICYMALFVHVRKLAPSTDKRRLRYLLIACPVALVVCAADYLGYLTLGSPQITGQVLAALLYLILLIVAYPQLSELHDFLARAFVIFVSTVTGACIFYLAAFFFSDSLPSFPSVIMASFLIVISVTPIKMILKKIFSYFYPNSKDVFTSLYEFDEKLEREKALLLAEMAPVFAHEIRNPLGSIKGAAQYLQTEASTDEQHKLLNVIIEEVNRLNSVVSQFLDYARPFTLKADVVNINDIVRKAVSVIRANRMADNITIAEDLHDQLPPVEADGQQILQVILNIALNAIEAMPQGGTLSFRTTRLETDVGADAALSIRDTGSGISGEDLSNIFKPFYTTKERGVGLGLAICQRIMREHGGSIRVKSISGQGSVFLLRLPMAFRR